jgi:hypothetical protein
MFFFKLFMMFIKNKFLINIKIIVKVKLFV